MCHLRRATRQLPPARRVVHIVSSVPHTATPHHCAPAFGLRLRLVALNHGLPPLPNSHLRPPPPAPPPPPRRHRGRNCRRRSSGGQLHSHRQICRKAAPAPGALRATLGLPLPSRRRHPRQRRAPHRRRIPRRDRRRAPPPRRRPPQDHHPRPQVHRRLRLRKKENCNHNKGLCSGVVNCNDKEEEDVKMLLRAGVYADDSGLKQLREKYQRVPVSELKENADPINDVLERDIRMTVRLQIVYGRLSIGSVRSAFEKSVGSRLQKFGGSDTKELLQSFVSLFKDEYKLPKGSVIELSRDSNHVLKISIQGEEVGSIQNKLLCQSILDLYIGDDPFDRSAKDNIQGSLASILKA